MKKKQLNKVFINALVRMINPIPYAEIGRKLIKVDKFPSQELVIYDKELPF